MSEEVLHHGLTHLQAAEFLYETRLFPEREFTFKHALTHEVAYGSLLQERRRVLHARIVEALEALAGDRLAEQVERLAHHALRGRGVGQGRDLLPAGRGQGRQHGRPIARPWRTSSRRWQLWTHLPESRDTTRAGHRPAARPVRTAALAARRLSRVSWRALREAEALAQRLERSTAAGTVSRPYHGPLPVGAVDHERAVDVGQRALRARHASGDVGAAGGGELHLWPCLS